MTYTQTERKRAMTLMLDAQADAIAHMKAATQSRDPDAIVWAVDMVNRVEELRMQYQELFPELKALNGWYKLMYAEGRH